MLDKEAFTNYLRTYKLQYYHEERHCHPNYFKQKTVYKTDEDNRRWTIFFSSRNKNQSG